jgi:T-complex protein 1 subunit gamma
MLKMLLDANGGALIDSMHYKCPHVMPDASDAGIVLTNDGNAILREIDVSHPAAKSMIQLSRTQDEEVGDGTTSVIILGQFSRPCIPLCL